KGMREPWQHQEHYQATTQEHVRFFHSISSSLWENRAIRGSLTRSEWPITPFALCVHSSSRCRRFSGAKPAAQVERIPPQNALGAEDHHQDDDDAPDFPAPIGQELQGCREVRNNKGAQQWTVKHVHAS